MVKIAMLLAAALLLYSPPTFAWGGLGHEAVCELAFRELDDTARQRVIALIQQDQEFPTFRASCNWPDRHRQRGPEHFVNLPRDATGLERDECPLADECAVSAIEDDFAVLASSEATDQEKLAALKFLGHWVGDIHQPLHAGFQDDRGGNRIRTQGSSCENLHALWERCIVEERLGMDPLTIVGELQARLTAGQRAEILASAASDAELAQRFGVTRQGINQARRRAASRAGPMTNVTGACHQACALLPELGAEEFAELVADIRQHGLRIRSSSTKTA